MGIESGYILKLFSACGTCRRRFFSWNMSISGFLEHAKFEKNALLLIFGHFPSKNVQKNKKLLGSHQVAVSEDEGRFNWEHSLLQTGSYLRMITISKI